MTNWMLSRQLSFQRASGNLKKRSYNCRRVTRIFNPFQGFVLSGWENFWAVPQTGSRRSNYRMGLPHWCGLGPSPRKLNRCYITANCVKYEGGEMTVSPDTFLSFWSCSKLIDSESDEVAMWDFNAPPTQCRRTLFRMRLYTGHFLSSFLHSDVTEISKKYFDYIYVSRIWCAYWKRESI